MKNKNENIPAYPVLIALAFIAVNAVITYFGRIYHPDNFSPDTVSFFENMVALVLFELLFAFIFGVTAVVIWKLVTEINSLIHNLKWKKKEK